MTYDSREKSRYSGQPVECYRFVCGSESWSLTSADRPVSLASGTYTPSRIERNEFDQSQEAETGALELRLQVDHDLAQRFVAFVPTQQTVVTIYRAHRGDESLAIVHWSGRLASVRFEGADAILVCLPLDAVLRRMAPRLRFQGQCNWVLYGEGCGIDRTLFRFSGAISALAANGTQLTVPGLNGHVDGWYTNGYVEAPGGEYRFIVAHAGNVATIMNRFATDVGVGTPVTLYAGCDRSEATCTNKFSNLVNHLGFPRIPTRNPHAGGVV